MFSTQSDQRRDDTEPMMIPWFIPHFHKSLQRQRAEARFPQNLYTVKVIPAGHLS